MALVIAIFVTYWYIAAVSGQSFQTLIISPPEPKVSEDVYMYAIDPLGTADECQIELPGSEGNLPDCISQIDKSGDIVADDGTMWGSFIRLGEIWRRAGSRYGEYKAIFSNLTDDCIEKRIVRRGHIRRQSKILDTDGTWTVTVYRDPQNISEIVPTQIGVAKTRGSLRYHWFKDCERLPTVSGPRYPITSPSDVGTYTIKRRARGKRGWSVEVTVTVASCPEGMALSQNGVCRPFTCSNGGVPSDEFSHCICSNLFDPRTICLQQYYSHPNDQFIIGHKSGTDTILTCGDLPGGNPRCRKMLFCQGGLYGCQCGSGWMGSNCDKPCPTGKWGPGCTQSCPKHDICCDRFGGPDRENLCR